MQKKNKRYAINKFKKDELNEMIQHVIDCLSVSLKIAHEIDDEESREINLAVYGLYLKPLELVLKEMPNWPEFESLYDDAQICLQRSGIFCPCERCSLKIN